MCLIVTVYLSVYLVVFLSVHLSVCLPVCASLTFIRCFSSVSVSVSDEEKIVFFNCVAVLVGCFLLLFMGQHVRLFLRLLL